MNRAPGLCNHPCRLWVSEPGRRGQSGSRRASCVFSARREIRAEAIQAGPLRQRSTAAAPVQLRRRPPTGVLTHYCLANDPMINGTASGPQTEGQTSVELRDFALQRDLAIKARVYPARRGEENFRATTQERRPPCEIRPHLRRNRRGVLCRDHAGAAVRPSGRAAGQGADDLIPTASANKKTRPREWSPEGAIAEAMRTPL